MIEIGVIGARGRMGRAIAAELETSREARLAGAADRGDDLSRLALASDVLIDFTAPDALAQSLDAAVTARKPLVIGTTGLDDQALAAVATAGRTVAVLQSANMSLGVTLLAHLVREAAARLGSDWDIEIAEMHHRDKVDAPSGTALLLGAAAAAGRGIELADHKDRGRDGITGARVEGRIGFASLRGGSVAGDHFVVLAGDGERLELGHRADSRAIFARGALRAALWLTRQPPGRYAMTDVLGIA